jgi:hypothetical protein
MKRDDDDAARRTAALLAQIEPLLVGKGSDVQGAALAYLTALWVCGHHPAGARPAVLLAHSKAVNRMIESINASGKR